MPARFAMFLLLGAILFAAGCSSSAGGHTATPTTGATTAPTTPATTAATATPSTTAAVAIPPSAGYTPSKPQPTPDAAAAALVSDWASGGRAAAAQVAAPAAVATVFAQPYPYAYIQSRGCTDATTNPGTCTYANRQNGSLYEIGVTRYGSGWYVSSVTVES